MYDPINYGAKGDGEALDTSAFQAAIDGATAAGGGVVVVRPGRYLIGTIHLKTGVTLHLQRGATLLGSAQHDHYARPPHWPGYEHRHAEHIGYALILAVEQQGVGVSGEGTIDGRGNLLVDNIRHRFPGETHPDHGGTLRPMLLQFVRCRDVRVSDVTLRDPAFWTQCYSECEGVYIRGITVRSHAWWNNDGIDIADSRRVRISDCDIDSADDGICLKSDKVPCEDIVVTNCVIRSWANAFKCGTLSGGGFRNVCVSNLTVLGAGHSGIALECVDGGVLENVMIQNVAMRNIRHALFLRLGARLRANARHESPGKFRRVHISNLVAEVHPGDPDAGERLAAPKLSAPHNSFPCIIAGLAGHPITDVSLENVRIVQPGGGDPLVARVETRDVPESPRSYPEYNCFGELPASGFFIRHARRIRLRDVAVKLLRPDFRPVLVTDRVHGLDLQGESTTSLIGSALSSPAGSGVVVHREMKLPAVMSEVVT